MNGNQSNNNAPNSGAAYIFARTGNTWAQQAYLKASNTGPSDEFGAQVAVSDGTVVIAAPYEASNATGVNGNGNDNKHEPGRRGLRVRAPGDQLEPAPISKT